MLFFLGAERCPHLAQALPGTRVSVDFLSLTPSGIKNHSAVEEAAA